MVAVQKRKWEKPVMRVVTDIRIVLECLYETYEMEGEQVLSGNNIHATVIYPFVKMLENLCVGITAEEIHKKLWKIYMTEKAREPFISDAESVLKRMKRMEENVNALQ